MDIDLYRRPVGPIADGILSIVGDLTGVWFTTDVAAATRRDLLFHDAYCATLDGRIRAFVMFTSHDGAIHITLMGTSPAYRRQGLGSALMKQLEAYAEALGFDELVAFTGHLRQSLSIKPLLISIRSMGSRWSANMPSFGRAGP